MTDLEIPGKSYARGCVLLGILDRMAREGRRTGTMSIEIDYQQGVCRRVRHQMKVVEIDETLPDELLESELTS